MIVYDGTYGILEKQLAGAERDYRASLQEAQLLYGLVRVLRPEIIVEAGAALGTTTAFLVKAAAENGIGHVYAYEIEEDRRERALSLLNNCVNPKNWTLGYDIFSSDVPACDFMFLDIDPKTAYQSVLDKVAFNPLATLVIHDTLYDETGGVLALAEQIEADEMWDTVHLTVDRGLLIARRLF